MQIANNISELIGKTPIVHIEDNIYAKCEFFNPFGSVKDRIGLNMIEAAMRRGEINGETTLIEPTSGNTGIALAGICAQKGIKLILTMPESMSMERRMLLSALGAQLELTPAKQGMNGAVAKARELHEQLENSMMLNQFENGDNPAAHAQTTANEIIDAMGSELDIFVAGVGTGGTISGSGRVLKEYNAAIALYAVEPTASPVLSGGQGGPHKIQGIGAGFVPKNLDQSIVDRVLQIDNDTAIATAKEMIKTKALLVGISSGANVAAARKVAAENPGKTVLTVLCDTAERYLSTDLFK